MENKELLITTLISKRPLREQVLEILCGKIGEEDIERMCIENNISIKVSETVFLYLTNSKDSVADILDIDGSTVIRRVKKFIEKMREI